MRSPLSYVMWWFAAGIGVFAIVCAMVSLSETASFIGLGLTLFFGAQGAMASLARARRAKERAASYRTSEASDSSEALRPGHVVLHGQVAYSAGEDRAMRVDLVQEGSEHESSGSWSHSWKEIERKLTVAPFYLTLRSTTASTLAMRPRIRVEPAPESSQLFDELEARILVREDGTPTSPRRVRYAELVPDESVWIVGKLERDADPEAHDAVDEPRQAVGYRANAKPAGWVLRGAPTLLVSSVPLVDHFQKRASLHVVQAVVALLLLVLPLTLLAQRVDRTFGHSTVGTVLAVFENTDDDNHVTGYSATVEAEGRKWRSESMPMSPAVNRPYEIRVGHTTSNDGPTAHWTSGEVGLLVCALILVLLARFTLRSFALRALPWYRRKKGFVESGSGRLKL